MLRLLCEKTFRRVLFEVFLVSAVSKLGESLIERAFAVSRTGENDTGEDEHQNCASSPEPEE